REALPRRCDLLRCHAVLPRQVLGGRELAAPWRTRVELEGVPRDGDLVRVRELRKRGLEPPLAQVAPWTYNVGPDVDSHGVCQRIAAGGDSPSLARARGV